jgi:thiol-disulfide isomerase/thioredoxin
MKLMAEAAEKGQLVTLLACVVLALSCQRRRQDPRTLVLGPVSCAPARNDRRCLNCVKAACCAEFQACANDAPCPCWAGTRVSFTSRANALTVCGPAPASYQALAACLDARCADNCPADDALQVHRLIGQPAPELAETQGLGGEGPKTLHDARGKVVIVDFWATWCGPCREALGRYQQIADRWPGAVAVLGLNVEAPEAVSGAQIVDFARAHGARFPILWDRSLRMEARYDVPAALPATFIVDRTGTVRRVHVGNDPAIVREVEALLSEVVP